MSNTFTSLIPDLFCALNVVSRELVGFIPAVTLDPDCSRGAIGQVVRGAVAPAATATDVVETMVPTDPSDVAIGNVSLTIQKSRKVRIPWTGEDQRATNTGPGYLSIRQQQMAEAMRTLCNEIETDLGLLYKSASRAYGTAGTTPFGTAGDFSDAAQVRKILADNGAPMSDLQLIVNTAAGASMRGKQAQAQISGDPNFQRNGILLDMHGFQMRESAKVANHTKGTGSGYLVNNGSNIAAGATAIAVDTGSGTVVAGDILTNSESGRDANKYVVGTALSAGSLAINAPGLLSGWTNNDGLAVGNSFAANMAFSRSAIHLATRLPSLPAEGDLAVMREIITDPVSGLSFEASVYPGIRKIEIEIAIAWGVACVKSAHAAILLG